MMIDKDLMSKSWREAYEKYKVSKSRITVY